MVRHIYSNGKLLITGEYMILRGARGLALPTSYGQHLHVSSHSYEIIEWKSLDSYGEVWFQARFTLDLKLTHSTDVAIADRLQSILKTIQKMNPGFFHAQGGVFVETRLEFHREWGLGSSSTLIYNLAQWSGVEALELSRLTLGGSGYDVAVAMHACPIIYSLEKNESTVEEVEFNPVFKDELWFVHMGKKEDSSKAVKAFEEIKSTEEQKESISSMTRDLLCAKELSDFEDIIKDHEEQMEDILQIPSASSRFSDYTGGIVKYLGAWGGDFMLVTGLESDLNYFRVKGLETIVSFEQMISGT